MIDLTQVGALPSYDNADVAHISFGLYLPGVRGQDGYSVVVRIIHEADRFNPEVKPKDITLAWQGGALDFWTVDVVLSDDASGHWGEEGEYLYRYELLWNGQTVTLWFADPFARRTDLGLMSAVLQSRSNTAFAWTDDDYQTPELQDLIVYELQVEEFNDTFSGVVDRLDYLVSLGVNCIELMPVTSHKLNFDWGYGPVYYFSPSPRFGSPEALKALVDAAHGRGVAVILDVVYEHADEDFPYCRVYDDIAGFADTPKVGNPMIGGPNVYGFGRQCDFSQTFTEDYFFAANQMWLDEFHIDGFRYDEVTDLYQGPRAAGYRSLVARIYGYSLTLPRFQRVANSYSRIIQCSESLGISRQVLSETYTNCAWTDELLNKAEDMVTWSYVDDDFAHKLDLSFSGYPLVQTVVNAAGDSIAMPVATFQYLESHDHGQLITFAGVDEDGGPLPEGNRDLFYKLQPYAAALYTCEGIPMLWQGQELADNYPLPGTGSARVHLCRDTHWEYFYDASGQALIRFYRQLAKARRGSGALRSRQSYYYYLQSRQGNEVIAYRRYTDAEDAMVFLNFGDSNGTIEAPFPRSGSWVEVVDSDVRTYVISVEQDGDGQTVTVPSNYGLIFVWQGT